MAELDVVLLPCGGGEWLVLPQAIVGKVYPYAPSLSAESPSEFVVGSMIIQNEKMPVLDFDFSTDKEEYSGLYRMLLVSTITKQSPYQRYAIVSHGEPELIRLPSADAIQKLSDGNHRYVSQYVSITENEDRRIALLNLPLFEAELKMR